MTRESPDPGRPSPIEAIPHPARDALAHIVTLFAALPAPVTAERVSADTMAQFASAVQSIITQSPGIARSARRLEDFLRAHVEPRACMAYLAAGYVLQQSLDPDLRDQGYLAERSVMGMLDQYGGTAVRFLQHNISAMRQQFSVRGQSFAPVLPVSLFPEHQLADHALAFASYAQGVENYGTGSSHRRQTVVEIPGVNALNRTGYCFLSWRDDSPYLDEPSAQRQAYEEAADQYRLVENMARNMLPGPVRAALAETPAAPIQPAPFITPDDLISSGGRLEEFWTDRLPQLKSGEEGIVYDVGSEAWKLYVSDPNRHMSVGFTAGKYMANPESYPRFYGLLTDGSGNAVGLRMQWIEGATFDTIPGVKLTDPQVNALASKVDNLKSPHNDLHLGNAMAVFDRHGELDHVTLIDPKLTNTSGMTDSYRLFSGLLGNGNITREQYARVTADHRQ